MRSLLLTIIVFGLLPWIILRPHIGVLTYTWLGLMNPHRLTYGFAYNFPFSTIIALVTIVAMLISSEKKRIPWTRVLVVWLAFIAWMNVSTYFALVPEDAVPEWDRAMKIQLMVFVSLLLLQGRQRINAFVWVIVVSIGFYGIKGGLFMGATGGQYLVMGPWDTFIADNNTLALALIMTIPLMRYLMVMSENKYVRFGLVFAMILTAMAIVSSHSRGAFLAGGTILFFLILKGKHRVRFLVATVVLLPVILMSMPDAWWDRMGSIADYRQDASSMGRINAWQFAINLAQERPIIGGGFNVFTEELFLRYAPEPLDFHDAHSIYFEVLAEHGYVGLSLFLLLGIFALRSCSSIIRCVENRDDLKWAKELAAMLQVSLLGYASGGAFLGLAYYDLYYDLIALIILLDHHVRRQVVVNRSVVKEVSDPHQSTKFAQRPPSQSPA